MATFASDLAASSALSPVATLTPCSPLAKQFVVGQSLRRRLQRLHDAVGRDGRLDDDDNDEADAAALAAWRQCADLDLTPEQESHLAAVAFNRALGRRRLGRRLDAAVEWASAAVDMSRRRRTDDDGGGHSDRCLLLLADLEFRRGRHHRVLACLDLVSDSSSFSALLLRLASAVASSSSSSEAMSAALTSALEVLPADLTSVKKLLRAVGPRDSTSYVLIMEAAFDRVPASQRADLHLLALSHCLDNSLVREAGELVAHYVSESSAAGPLDTQARREGHERYARLCERHVRTLARGGMLEEAASCCAALVFLCQSVGDRQGLKAFLWRQAKALAEAGRADEAARLVALHKMDGEPEFLPMRVEAAMASGDFGVLEDILSALAAGKVKEEHVFQSNLFFLLAKFLDRVEPRCVLALTQDMLASARNEAGRKSACLLEVNLNLLLRLAATATAEEDGCVFGETEDGWVRATAVAAMFEAVAESVRSSGDPAWTARAMWNLALRCCRHATRLAALSAASHFDSGGLAEACLLLRMATLLSLAEADPAAAADVREEVSALTANHATSSSSSSRQGRLMAVYRVKAALLLEPRVASLVKSVAAATLDDPSADSTTLSLVAGMLRDEHRKKKRKRAVACDSYAKLVCRVYREAIKRSSDEGAGVGRIVGLFNDLVVHSAANCTTFQAGRDVDDLVSYMSELDEADLPQDTAARLVAALWNEAAVESMANGSGGERSAELRGMARSLAPFAKKHSAHFREKMEAAAKTKNQ